MGNTFTIEVYVPGEYYEGKMMQRYWAGESLILALYNLYKAKRTGCPCVQLIWRGMPKN